MYLLNSSHTPVFFFFFLFLWFVGFTGNPPTFDILFSSEWYFANDDRGRYSPWPLHVFFVYVDLNVTISYSSYYVICPAFN